MKKIIHDKYFYGNTGKVEHTDMIVECIPELDLHPSYVGDIRDRDNVEGILDRKHRQSKNAHIWVEENPFIPMLDRIMQHSNNLIWKFENYKGIWEGDHINYIVYDEPGDHFDWHSDSYDHVHKDYQDRILSVSYCLSHASEYEGGEFCIADKEFHMDYGDFIVFPSQNVDHCIKPLISGERKVLVGFTT